MQVPTAEACSEKRIRNSVKAYLEGLKGLNWIVGVIGRDVAYAKEMLISLQNYGIRQRYQELSGWLSQAQPKAC
jgi:hypothetical protein